MPTVYDSNFYKSQQDGSYRSAQKIIPLLLSLIRPKSVLDIGCGVGTWLSVFKNEHSINDIRGVDGDYVNRATLKIPESEFFAHDLKHKYNSGRKFDLAMSLEVGEHLPDSSADSLIESLVGASDIVMFSAALPGQIGTYHINEQYPEYWAKKFLAKGYIPVDCLRKQIWDSTSVEWWYKQNIILYVNENVYSHYASVLDVYRIKTDPAFLTRIHPEMLGYFQKKYFQMQTFSGFTRAKLYPLKKWFRKLFS